jgi:hypothetical protein
VNKYALRATRQYGAQAAATRIDPISKWRMNLSRQFSERIIAELYHQVNMSRHQTVSDHLRIVRLQSLAEKLKILFSSALEVQIESPVVKPRDDMKQTTCYMESRKSRHSPTYPRITGVSTFELPRSVYEKACQ